MENERRDGMNIQFQTMMQAVNSQGYKVDGKLIQRKDIVFEERVKMNCFYCGRYNKGWKCPPKLPDIDVEKLLSEFDSLAFVYLKMPLDDNDFTQVRTDSSVQLHRALLECERWLYRNNNSTALSFIGGSCKLCKNGCASNGCANPYESRSPVEALGINVVKSAQNVGIDIAFPPKDYMMRIGLLLW